MFLANQKITNSTRASRRIPVLFLHAQKVALIESMNPQWENLSEERKEAEKIRDSTRGTRRMTV